MSDLRSAVESNQARMSLNPFETMLALPHYRNWDSRLEEAALQVIPTCRTS